MTSRMLDPRRIFAVGIAFIFGLSVEISPDIYSHVPDLVRPVFSSSAAFATVLVVCLSLLFRIGIAKRVKFQLGRDAEASESLRRMVEEQGAVWGMRREIATRGEYAINEAVNTASAMNPDLKQVEVTLAFDEFNLDAEVAYEGVPLEMVESAPSIDALETDQGIAQLSTFLIRQHADRVRVKIRKGTCTVLIHLDH